MDRVKRLVRLEKAIPVLCMILCLLSVSSSGVKLSAKAGSVSVVVNSSESIQAAINNATTGNTILVSAGTYNESLEVNKSISLIGEDRDNTIINGQNNQFIINITADNVTIEGFTIQSALNPASGINMQRSDGDVINYNIVENSKQGIALTSSNINTISNNVITANTQQGISLTFSNFNTISNNVITANTQQGIYLTLSSNNIISDNIITANAQGGIVFYESGDNLFSRNMVSGNNGGFSIFYSDSNVLSGNTLTDNYPGELITYLSNYNAFYDNNFYDTVQVANGLTNTWNDSVEGNFWSNYAGHNSGDGTGFENYTVAAGNIDFHPLMGEFSSFDANLAGETYQVSIISNSTVSDFNFEVGTETGNKIIQFNVTGAENTIGFSRIAIPTGLMNASVSVLVGEEEIVPTLLSSPNTALNYLYFTYSQSNQTVLIISSETLNLYNQLLDKFLTLNDTYYGLLGNLSSLYNGLLNSYADLNASYHQLQQSYADLNASYQQHLLDYSQNLQNVRSLMYIFAAATAVLIVITVYLSKHTHSPSTKAPEEKDRY